MEIIRELREKLGMTQHDVAHRLGVHTQFVSNAERGVSCLPPKRFKKLSRILKVSPEVFVHYHVERYEKAIREKAGL
jgi:transcriptional regulator with XRE-family HTH domain